jgi:hypothetical protein
MREGAPIQFLGERNRPHPAYEKSRRIYQTSSKDCIISAKSSSIFTDSSSRPSARERNLPCSEFLYEFLMTNLRS